MNYYKNWVACKLRSWADTYEHVIGSSFECDRDGEEQEVEAEAHYYVNELADKLLNDTCTIDDYSNILFHLYQKFYDVIDVPQLHPYPVWVNNKSCQINPQEEYVSEYIKFRFWSTVRKVEKAYRIKEDSI